MGGSFCKLSVDITRTTIDVGKRSGGMVSDPTSINVYAFPALSTVIRSRVRPRVHYVYLDETCALLRN